ncbi:secreted RxLR effector protein 161-like [Bidens hawaiensis]|uniref:secreted RxLR effector protein 161-like n=1 Tax=Bidens hawaiensis TaxID=980011 RepID=UPI004049E20D
MIEMSKDFEKVMQKKFEMSATGELTFFLGLQVDQKENWMFIYQTKYVHDMLEKFNMEDSAPYDTQANPKESHLKSVNKILRYVKGKPKLGLWYTKGGDLDLVEYTDFDYGGCNQNKKSTMGGGQFLAGRLVSWQCKKQTSVAISTCKAEYIAVSSCCS